MSGVTCGVITLLLLGMNASSGSFLCLRGGFQHVCVKRLPCFRHEAGHSGHPGIRDASMNSLIPRRLFCCDKYASGCP